MSVTISFSTLGIIGITLVAICILCVGFIAGAFYGFKIGITNTQKLEFENQPK